MAETSKRKLPRQIEGVVVSDKMSKTRVVEVKRTIRHALYRKNLIRRSRFFVHDEENKSKVGDTVVAISTSPISRHKNFKLWKIVEKRVAQ